MKFAIVSHVLPPSSSGQAMVLHRLLKDIDPSKYCLISQRNYNSKDFGGYANRLSGKYYKILTELKFRIPDRFNQGVLSTFSTIIQLVNILIAFAWVPFRGIQIARIIRKENCDSLVACTADLINLPASYLASRIIRIPFYPYIFDYYSFQWTEKFPRFFANLFEPLILRGAAKIIVPNEYLQDELKNRYGVAPVVIHNPYYMPIVENEAPWPFKKNEINIVYTGAIYYAHYDAFRNLVAAIERIGRKDIKLHIYTENSPGLLESNGIRGPVIYHGHLEISKALEVQRHADILFLPLAFESSNPVIIKTSSPGKMGEYLASGRPVLVHSPEDSFVSQYFKKNKCGIVADKSDEKALVSALCDIIESNELRIQIVKNALQCAREDFDLASVREKFINLLDTGS